MSRKLIHIFDLLQSILKHRRGHQIKYINYQMSQDLLMRAEKDIQLKSEMQKTQQRYKKLLEAYSTKQTPSIPQSILKKINDSRQIYFYLGFQQNVLSQDMWQLQIFLIKNFKPKVKKPFTLVFFNEKAKDNYVFTSFRQFISSLPFEILNELQEIIVVKPYFYHKTMDWMMFGTIPKYIKSRTKFVSTYKQLCDYLKISMNILAEYLPYKFYHGQLEKFQIQNKQVQNFRINIKGQQRGQVDNKLVLQFQKSITSMIIKPGYQINNLQDYEISAQGIPTILKMLVFYFDSHQDGLNLEGLFRKSVSIDQENETIREVLSNNYDYLLQVENPHIIANLIKRFFSTLKSPAFPFQSFEKLMNDQGVQNKVQFFKQIFDQIPGLNKRSILFLFTFFKDKVIKHENQNKMSSQNVAICLSPCIFRSRVPSAADLLYATKSVMYCKMFLTEFEYIFGSVEEIETIYRTSFKESQQKLQQNIQMTLQFVVQTLAQNQLQMKGNKRVSHRYENEMEQNKPAEIKLEQRQRGEDMNEVQKKVQKVEQSSEKLEQKTQLLFLDLENNMQVPNFRNSMSFEDQGTHEYFFQVDNSKKQDIQESHD